MKHAAMGGQLQLGEAEEKREDLHCLSHSYLSVAYFFSRISDVLLRRHRPEWFVEAINVAVKLMKGTCNVTSILQFSHLYKREAL